MINYGNFYRLHESTDTDTASICIKQMNSFDIPNVANNLTDKVLEIEGMREHDR